MQRNYSKLIANKQKRQLTAYGYKFLSRYIEIASKQRGLTRYHKEMQPIKDKLKEILDYLIIDKEMTIDDIKKILHDKKLIES